MRSRAGLGMLVLLLLLASACARIRPGSGGASPPSERVGRGAPGRFAVGTRQVTFTDPSRSTSAVRRGGATTQGRTLATTIWYPASGDPAAPGGEGVAAAAGRFPVVLFSHGLRGTPGDYQALLARWASAGFVVVAPAYPLTHRGAPEIVPGDLTNQPGDA